MTESISNILCSQTASKQPGKRNYTPLEYDLGYITDGLHESVATAKKCVLYWVNDIIHRQGDRKRWVYLFGKSGCGKTHLLKKAEEVLKKELADRAANETETESGKEWLQKYAVEQARLTAEKTVSAWRWTTLFSRLLNTNTGSLESYVSNVDVLLIDDIGSELIASEKAQSLSMKKLYDIMEARLGKWTFMTSNLEPKQLPDARIASRLFRGQNNIIDMRGADDYMFTLYKTRQQKKC